MSNIFKTSLSQTVVLSLLALGYAGSAVNAAPLENNPARILAGNQLGSLPGSALSAETLSDAPFGTKLKGIVVVGDKTILAKSVNAAGVVIKSANAQLNDPALAVILNHYIGQPLSQRLIGKIRDDITLFMRSRNRPLVAVIVPPQEVTSGAVQLLILPFKVGSKTVQRVETGYNATSTDKVLNTVRIGQGDEVAADVLLSDINWLNLNPFRKVEVVFAPGDKVGTTDLILSLTDQKPWQVYAGYSNSGTTATGKNRIFAGFVANKADWGDQQISYQVTTSPETMFGGGFTRDDAYIAHSLGYFVPLSWADDMRHKLTIRGNFSRSNANLTGPFVATNQTYQASIDYAGIIETGHLIAGSSLDWFVGADFKRQDSDVLFAGVSTGVKKLDVIQFNAGLRGKLSGDGYDTSFSLKGVYSPGGLTTNNSDAAFVAASGVASDKASYKYLSASLHHHMVLPADFGLNLAVIGQYSPDSLPSTEKFGIGGSNSVRGYETNELSGDSGLSVQAELHAPRFSLLQDAQINASADAFVFVDAGIVHSIAASSTGSLLSAGVGLNVNVNANLQASITIAHAFKAGSITAKGSNMVQFGLTLSF